VGKITLRKTKTNLTLENDEDDEVGVTGEGKNSGKEWDRLKKCVNP